MLPTIVVDVVTIACLFLVRVGLPLGLVMSLGYWAQRRLRLEGLSLETENVDSGKKVRWPVFLRRLMSELYALPAWLPTVALLTIAGIAAMAYRLSVGLGVSTHLSQAYPWGLWIAVTLFMIAFSSGTFVLPIIVYVLNLDQFRVALRPTILAGLLGFGSVTITMIMGLGRWDRFIYLIQYPNVTSPLALCFWCIMLYTIVLLIEFIPGRSEQTRWATIIRFLKQLPAVLAIAGATLALTFQFSLGTVFVIAAQRVHPLWHTPILPAIFLVSSITSGLAMVIAGGTGSHWIFGRGMRQEIVAKVASWVPWALGAYIVVLVVDLFYTQDLTLSIETSTILYMIELVVGTLLPMFFFSLRKVRESRTWCYVGAAALLFGVLMNRLDVAWLSTASASGTIYLPSLVEVVIQTGLICGIILIYTLVAHYLPLFEGLVVAEEQTAGQDLVAEPAFQSARTGS